MRQHAKRLDVDAYAEGVGRTQGRRLRVAVIGAGIAGLSAARTLADHNHEVVVVEKSRGPGGRTATRRRDGARFDHGAQYFTARDPRFAQHLASWRQEGVIARWPERMGAPDGQRVPGQRERWRGADGMNALAKRIGNGLDIVTEARVEAIRRDGDGWMLECAAAGPRGPVGRFDAVLVTAPAPQAADLLRGAHDQFAERAAAVAFAPCWAAMFSADASAAPDWQAAFCGDDTLAWIGSRERDGQRDWVVHATPQWSTAHLEDDADDVARLLLEAFRRVTGAGADAGSAVAHRWRYARTEQALEDGCLFDAERMIGACGDWCHRESRVEAAWLSGKAAAGRVLAAAALAADREPVQAALV